jgi:glycosyltransferase involved in cell wall biosynthesis
MRVLHITTEFPPVVVGGLGTALGGLARASAAAGVEVGVLLILDGPPPAGRAPVEDSIRGRRVSIRTGGQDEPEADGVEDGESRATGLTLFQMYDCDPLEVAVRIAEEWRPDVVHLHVPWALSLTLSVVEKLRLPLVYTIHSLLRAAFDIGHEPEPILEYSGRQERAIQLATRVIALTNNEAALTSEYYPQARGRVRVVGNGVEDSEAARDAARGREREGAPLVLYAGRLVERKGIRELLDAIPHILDRAPETRFVIAGGPPGVAAPELERRWLPAGCVPLCGRIRFTGWLSTGEVARWYQAADVLVVPSRYEPFGMVILEGMLYGLPVAAANVGGPRELLEHERTGLLFPPGQAGALAQAVLRLVFDRQLCRTLGERAAREVRARWLWPAVVGEIHRVYEEAIEESRARPGGPEERREQWT